MTFDDDAQHPRPQSPAKPRDEASARRPLSLVAVIAAVLVAALAATIFAVHPGKSTSSRPGSVSVAPTATATAPVSSALPAMSFNAATIASATDIWAVGTAGTTAVIAHNDGHGWQSVPSATFANSALNDISFGTPTDGWAVGDQQDAAGTLTPLLVHDSEGKWTAQTLPLHNVFLRQVQMFGAEAGWVVGSDTTGAAVFLRYANGAWQQVPFVTGAGTATLAYDIPRSGPPPDGALVVRAQMLSPTDVWAAGSYHNQNVVWHYTGGQWQTALSLPHTDGADFFWLGANAPNDIWALGTALLGTSFTAAHITFSDQRPLSSGGAPTLLHYDGHKWSEQSADIAAGGQFLGGATWLTSYGDVNGQQKLVGLLLNTGGTWRVTTFPQPYDVAVATAAQADGSTLALVATGAPGNPQTPHLLRYVNGTWSIVE